MNKMLVKIYNDPAIPPYDRIPQMKKRFCGGMTEVCEPERKEMEEETKKKKAEEKAARMAAREAKKKSKAAEKKEKDEL